MNPPQIDLYIGRDFDSLDDLKQAYRDFAVQNTFEFTPKGPIKRSIPSNARSPIVPGVYTLLLFKDRVLSISKPSNPCTVASVSIILVINRQ